MRRRGFTLLEAVLSLAVLGSLMLVIFAVFSVGVAGFRVGTSRLQLQSDLRRVLAPLRKDLENSSFQSMSSTALEIPSLPARRDGLCLNGLRDALSDSSYAAGSGLPQWDCFVLYFATQDLPEGRLVRLLLRDTTPSVLSLPRSLTAADLSLANPDLIGREIRVLSDLILDFRVRLDPSNQMIQLGLKLRSKAGKSRVEVLEIETIIDPANTSPRL
ncbi:hypothetical protein ABS71_02920 [bacterium SCN 62-11]|nr:MAG: hypothetical protein ABS71_02920 [bacterium SCN 62-11]